MFSSLQNVLISHNGTNLLFIFAVLKDLDLQIEKNKNLEQLGLRSKVEEEIFTSELSYLHQLEIILKVMSIYTFTIINYYFMLS